MSACMTKLQLKNEKKTIETKHELQSKRMPRSEFHNCYSELKQKGALTSLTFI